MTPETLVQRMLEPALKLGVSTPRADPAGDYAVQVFERIEKSGVAGAASKLSAKALQLTGGPTRLHHRQTAASMACWWHRAQPISSSPIARTPWPRRASSRYEACRAEAINVSASYGVTILNGAPDEARRFVTSCCHRLAKACWRGMVFRRR